MAVTDHEHQVTQTIARLTPLDAVLALLDSVPAVMPEGCSPQDAVGAALAADVTSRLPRPAHATALRDGWAVRAETTTDAAPFTPVPLESAVLVDLGAALPVGADAVLPFEAVDSGGGMPMALAPIAPGDGVLAAGADAGGADLSRPETLRRSGERVRPIDVGVFAALGLRELGIRRPRLRIAAAGPDPLRDAIVAFIWTAAVAAGCRAEIGGCDDDLSVLAAGADAVLRVGGTGCGRNDRAVHDLASVGTVAAHGIALAPGQTAAYGRIGNCPILLVPGRFDAAIVVWLTLGRRLTERLCGASPPVSYPARLVRKIASSPGLAEVVLVRHTDDGVEPIAAGHLPMAAMARADGFVVIPAEREGFPAGATVAVMAL